MSVEESGTSEILHPNNVENTASEPEKITPITPPIDINEMQPNVEKSVHVTKIVIPTPNKSNLAEVNVMTNEAASESIILGASPHVVVQSDDTPLAGSVIDVPTENGDIVPIQLQPTYPAAHPLPDVTVDVDDPKKVGEVVPITIQPTYPMAHNDTKASTTEPAIPAYPAGHFSISAPVVEESVPTVQIKPDLVRFGTVVTDGPSSVSEAPYLPEPVYPAAHHLPVILTAVVDDDEMNEISLSSATDPGTTGHNCDDTQMAANGRTNPTQVTIEQGESTSRKRGIVLTVVLAVLLISSFAIWGVYKFILQTSPA